MTWYSNTPHKVSQVTSPVPSASNTPSKSNVVPKPAATTKNGNYYLKAKAQATCLPSKYKIVTLSSLSKVVTHLPEVVTMYSDPMT